jgi:hypothetical protein
VVVKGDVPSFIAEEAIYPRHSRPASLIAPGELSILQVDFLELTEGQNGAESAHELKIESAVVFIFRLVDEVEISHNQPLCAVAWPQASYVVEKSLLVFSS